MQKILFKRSFRNLKTNFPSYLALFILLIFCMMLAVANNSAAETIMLRTSEYAEEHMVEDGEFVTTVPLSQSELDSITAKGITIEDSSYADFGMKDDSLIRTFRVRENLNKIKIIKGELANADDEIVIERRYSEVHNINVGDKIDVGAKTFTVKGIGVTPDYECVLVDNATPFTDAEAFGTAFLTKTGYTALMDTKSSKSSETSLYAYRLNDKMSHDELADYVSSFVITHKDIQNMGSMDIKDILFIGHPKFQYALKAEDNMRIHAAYNDQIVNKETGIYASILIVILISYVISVFVSHEIQEDSSVIGTLYGLGVTRRDLLLHYLYVPVLVTVLGGGIGCLLGFSPLAAGSQINTCYEYFSMPNLQMVHPTYLILLSVLMPAFIAIAVNILVILKKLNKPVLSLIRREDAKPKKMAKVRISNLGFVPKFQLRQFVREYKAGIAVVAGLLLALLILMLCLNCIFMCNGLTKGAENDVTFDYVYTYKFPTASVPEGGEECYGETFKKEIYGYSFDVVLLGINKDNQFFPIKEDTSKDEVVISSAMASKFGIKVGETLTFPSADKTKEYSFKVVGIHQFSPSFYMYMDIDCMRELFEADKDYFNIVLSNKELEVPPVNLYSKSSKDDIVRANDLVTDIMKPMISALTVTSVVVFVLVMYLMLKMMIDKSKRNISLMGVFGYTPSEIRRLYLDGNFFVVLIGAIITIPLAKLIMDIVYPIMCSNVACALDLTFPWWVYPAILLVTMALYLAINALLVFKIKKINPSDVIKNRE